MRAYRSLLSADIEREKVAESLRYHGDWKNVELLRRCLIWSSEHSFDLWAVNHRFVNVAKKKVMQLLREDSAHCLLSPRTDVRLFFESVHSHDEIWLALHVADYWDDMIRANLSVPMKLMDLRLDPAMNFAEYEKRKAEAESFTDRKLVDMSAGTAVERFRKYWPVFKQWPVSVALHACGRLGVRNLGKEMING